ncbi:MAG: hypothetical protein IJ077_08455 [Eubacterium sp.]|nr:hypothetical protein [Eubacterium sp.]
MRIFANDNEIKTKIFIRWGGDYKQAARSLSFAYLPMESSCRVGDKVIMYDNDGKLVFTGMCIDAYYNTSQKVYNVDCVDILYNTLKSKAFGRFTGTSSQICRKVCNIFNINSKIELNGQSQQLIATGDLTYYDVMAKALRRDVGDEYFNIRAIGNNVYFQRPTNSETVATLTSQTNIREADYSETVRNMINKIAVIDDFGTVVTTRQNSDDLAKFGLMQNVVTEQYTDDFKLVMPELHKIDYTASLSIDGDVNCITGNTVNIIEPHTGFNGRFFILNDQHVWQNDDYITTLGVLYNV